MNEAIEASNTVELIEIPFAAVIENLLVFLQDPLSW